MYPKCGPAELVQSSCGGQRGVVIGGFAVWLKSLARRLFLCLRVPLFPKFILRDPIDCTSSWARRLGVGTPRHPASVSCGTGRKIAALTKHAHLAGAPQDSAIPQLDLAVGSATGREGVLWAFNVCIKRRATTLKRTFACFVTNMYACSSSK